MPYNGSGTYSLPAGNPVVTGTTISSTVQNNTMSDVATALTNCITRDGQSTALANLPMGGFRHTGAADAIAAGQYLVYGQTIAALTVTNLTVTTLTGATITASGNFAVTGNLTVTGTFAANGGATLGDAAGDSLTINSNTASIPNGLSLTGGSVGVGGGTASQSNFASRTTNRTITSGMGQLMALSTDSQAADLGGQLVLGGSFTGTTPTSFAAVSGRKENSTDSNISGYLSLSVTRDGVGTVEGLRITSDRRVYGLALHNNAGSLTGATNQYIASGTYTPTGTAVANCSAVTPGVSQWIRTGNVVHVWGSVTLSFTTTTLSTTMGLSIPIASNFTLASDLNGDASGTGTLSGSALTDTIMVGTADTTNDRANFNIPTCQASGSHTYSYSFAYEVK